MPLDRSTMLTLWVDSWKKGHGYVPWKDALAGLTPAQALWRPSHERHPIWAHANHVSFWREYLAASARGQPLPGHAEIATRSFEAPVDITHATMAAWHAAIERVEKSHELVEEAIRDPAIDLDVFGGLVAHDAYHLGQIMLLRAMQGLKPLM